jgi:hypothetical protein
MKQHLSWANLLCAIVVGMLLGVAAQADNDQLFGFPTVVGMENSLWVDWRELQSAMRSDELIIAQCRAKSDVCASFAVLSFIAIVKGSAGV